MPTRPTDGLLLYSSLPSDVYSLNVPLPGAVSALAADLARDLPDARARARDEHTMVAKRLGRGDRVDFHRISARTREALAGAPAFDLRVTGVDYFEEAAAGPSPVVYLAVESPGLCAIHRQLSESFAPVDGMEGDAYVPHVTVARGGSLAGAKRLAGREIEPIEWTVTELVFWDTDRGQHAGSVVLSQ